MLEPEKREIDGIRIDSLREIAANKTGTLVGRNESKDLCDLRMLLQQEGHLLLLPPRRSERVYPRHVKIKMSSYARNRGKSTRAA